jgi:hypothetical protein
MQTETYYEVGEGLPMDSVAEPSALEAMQARAAQLRPSRTLASPEGFAVRGLLLILPVSLALWCAIGLAVWAWVK